MSSATFFISFILRDAPQSFLCQNFWFLRNKVLCSNAYAHNLCPRIVISAHFAWFSHKTCFSKRLLPSLLCQSQFYPSATYIHIDSIVFQPFSANRTTSPDAHLSFSIHHITIFPQFHVKPAYSLMKSSPSKISILDCSYRRAKSANYPQTELISFRYVSADVRQTHVLRFHEKILPYLTAKSYITSTFVVFAIVKEWIRTAALSSRFFCVINIFKELLNCGKSVNHFYYQPLLLSTTPCTYLILPRRPYVRISLTTLVSNSTSHFAFFDVRQFHFNLHRFVRLNVLSGRLIYANFYYRVNSNKEQVRKVRTGWPSVVYEAFVRKSRIFFSVLSIRKKNQTWSSADVFQGKVMIFFNSKRQYEIFFERRSTLHQFTYITLLGKLYNYDWKL